jgi:hypothetical protein
MRRWDLKKRAKTHQESRNIVDLRNIVLRGTNKKHYAVNAASGCRSHRHPFMRSRKWKRNKLPTTGVVTAPATAMPWVQQLVPVRCISKHTNHRAH